MKKTLTAILFVLTFNSVAFAAGGDSTAISYTPVIFGAVKARLEFSTYDGEYRFNVRNSRLGAHGNVSPRMRYQVQVDLNNQGNISMLDSYVQYDHKNLEITLGQQQYRFSRDLDRGPSSSLFSNRSFLAKFLTSYHGRRLEEGSITHYVRSIGSRDIGALVRYDLPIGFPVKLSLGAFNGWGSNNPQWSDRVNIVTRADIGPSHGLSGSISFYDGATATETQVVNDGGVPLEEEFEQGIRMFGGGLYYNHNSFNIEAEYAQRRLDNVRTEVLHAAFLQGSYKFNMPTGAFSEYVMPQLRWDYGKDIDFRNEATRFADKFSGHRITAGVNFGFVSKLIGSELRFSYEKYLLKHKPSDYTVNKLLHDKFTIELVASF